MLTNIVVVVVVVVLFWVNQDYDLDIVSLESDII